MKLLAVDTSGPGCGVAILTEDGIRHECAVMNHKTHSVNLLPMIDNAFQSTGLTIQDMDRLAVVVGPGSARFRMRALGRCTAQRSLREKIARIG